MCRRLKEKKCTKNIANSYLNIPRGWWYDNCDKNTFELIKRKYGLHASWAIWDDEGNTPKSNMDDLSFFEEDQISTLCRTAGIAQILQ